MIISSTSLVSGQLKWSAVARRLDRFRFQIRIYLFIPNLSPSQINTKKMGDNKKTVRSSVSAATLLKVNNLINTSDANYICKFGDFSNKNIML